MEKIHYAGDVVYTGTEISHALLDYAHALAIKGSSATVEIPTYQEDGTRGLSELLIGPASQIIADTAETDWEEIVDADTVSMMKAATRRLGAPHAEPIDPREDVEINSEFPDFGDLP
jgi:hypothetical protein